MKKRILSAEAVASHFRSIEPTPTQLRYINAIAFDEEYIVVSRGPEAIREYKKAHNKENVRGKDRIGHCTHCHQEFILPETWRINETDPLRRWDKQKRKCPNCGCMSELISAHRGIKKRTLRRYVTCFESSKKDPDVILGKGIMAIRTVEDDYKTCDTVTYTVTMYYFKPGETPVMYKRQAWYSMYSHRVVPYEHWYGYDVGADGIGSPWMRQKEISDLWHQYINRGYSPCIDKNSAMRMIRKKAWKYCQLEKFIKSNWRYTAYDYLRYFAEYAKYPGKIEMLMKMNLRCIVEDKVFKDGVTKWCVNWQATKPKNVLRCRLTKADKEYMKVFAVSTESLSLYSLIQRHGQNYTLAEADSLRKYVYDYHRIAQAKPFPDVRKLLKYGEKQQYLYVGISKEAVVHDYFDYLKECHELRYNLEDKTIAWPRNFMQAHRAASRLCQIKKMEILAKKEKERKNWLESKITKRLKELEKYNFETEKFFIRPAASIDELIQEGAENHSCVGSYIDTYAHGNTNIFFIRQKDSPGVPFFTVEIKDDRIIQCRTKDNKNADKGSDVEQFVKLFERIKLQRRQKGETA